MFRSGGGVRLAVVIACLSVFFVLSGAVNHSSDRQTAYEPTQQEARYPGQKVGCSGANYYEPPCAPQLEDSARRSQWAEEQDLIAQRTMARWTVVMGAMAIVGVAFSGIGILLVLGTLRATQDMTIVTREIGENESKAYVNTSAVTLMPIRFGDDLQHYELIPTLKNTGSTPATRITVGGEFWIVDETFTALERPRELFRQTLYSQDVVDLQPNDPQPVPFILGPMPCKIIEENARNALVSRYIFIKGYIHYSDVFKSRYLTEFAYRAYIPMETVAITLTRLSDRVATYKKIGRDEDD